jgi:hypothetical protein
MRSTVVVHPRIYGLSVDSFQRVQVRRSDNGAAQKAPHPLLISDFGIAASRPISHPGPAGANACAHDLNISTGRQRG